MSCDIRRQWQVAFAALLIGSSASLIGAVGHAADSEPPAASDPDAQAIVERLDAMIERAAARLEGRQASEGDLVEPDADVETLRERLEEAETQIRLLKNVVIQALRAQSEAEEELRRVQGTQGGAAALEVEPAPSEAQNLMLAERVETLADSVARLRADVDALRGRTPTERPPEPDRESVVRPPSALGETEGTGAAAALEEDPMLPEAGMGGRYEPLLEDEPSRATGSDYAAVPSDQAGAADGQPIKVAEVHFDSGSARLTPGGERRTLDAVEQIRSMEAAKVRVVAFTDRVGDSAYNLVLSKERALSVATVLENAGFDRDMVEVVGNGEEGIPVPTPDGVPEPLNRSAGIFVMRDATG